jgi:hypothetical protein
MRMPTMPMPKPGLPTASPATSPALAGLTKHMPKKPAAGLQRSAILKRLGGLK